MQGLRTKVMVAMALLVGVALAGPTAAQDDEVRAVTVQATGLAERDPDQVMIRVAVETFADTAQEATAANAAAMDKVIAALRKQKIDRDDIRTVGYDLWPEHAPPEQRRGQGEIIGYRAINRVEVTLDEVDRAGRVIDAAIGAGANRVEGVSFTLAEPGTAEQEALRDAVARAREKAETLAAAAGASLGPVLRIDAGGGGFPGPVAYRTMAMEQVETPIEPGTLTVRANVTVSWLLE